MTNSKFAQKNKQYRSHGKGKIELVVPKIELVTRLTKQKKCPIGIPDSKVWELP